ncbi:tata-binding protein associated factor taf2 [Ophiostoma piceae UAMH 11346]|uniref:Transcription initiation factor TFIID subunit 2 n=1 Tax=Ophiostoma piceae (strain UAMH 11346) TaxID=1262450 RepID=S3D9X1_OPHP1|nr:tata-binding protein associated factor taf2 [Ophiostoma piceae UAMH 11346]
MPGILQPNGVLPTTDAPGDGSEANQDSLPPIEEFVVVNQEVSIEVNFRDQSVQGESRITIYLTNPSDPPDEVALDARQSEIDTSKIRVNGKAVRATYRDPYEALDLPPSWDLTASNFPVLKSRMRNLLPRRRRDLPCEKREQTGCNPADRSLRIALRPQPPTPLASGPADGTTAQQPGKLKVRLSTVGLSGTATSGANGSGPAKNSSSSTDAPTDGVYEIIIPFRTAHIRDGLHFVGVEDNDTRFPHVYTRHSPEPGIAACIFPCLDDPGSRCFWKIHIKTPRTLGDALMQPLASQQSSNDAVAVQEKSVLANGNQASAQLGNNANRGERQLQLTEEDKLLDMTVVCSGNLVGEKIDDLDESKKIMTFEITDHGAAASHIGFAVGPFEHVDLFTGFRTEEDDEKLGASALKIHGYCLPGRQLEVQNTCVSLTTAADEFAMTYGRYPYDSFKLCFVDDMVSETTPLLSFSLCSTRLLFPDNIIERDFDVTRKLVHSLAYQYFGSYIVPNQRTEMWLTVGIAYYMTDLFLSKLCGNNDYRYRMKEMSDLLAEEDRGRPSLHDLGTYTYLGDFEMEFMALKAPLVLFILDKRLTKAAGSASASLARVISKIISKANTSGWGDNNNEIISSESFRRVCEKTSQYQLEQFWNQWVLGAGCPWLSIKQRFNRKRLCVEIGIHQTQETVFSKPRPMRHGDFWRELVEKRHGTYSRKVQRLFTGPMTIRIHEANGTPYEHIVEIREDAAFTGGAKFDIPYNTKYKRLKRNRKNRERAAAAAANNEGNVEGGEDAILFSLGDKLDTPDDMASWGLIDWNEQDEKNMDQESYEWIRIDSDFEWLCRMNTNMPAWMYLSQLQQDRDIVAQQDTLLYLSRIREHAMSASILTRTLYDERYFHGLRTMAAQNLARQVWKASDAQNGSGAEADGGQNGDSGDARNGNSAGDDKPGADIVYRGLDQLMHVFRHLHCYDDATSKPNDFTDMRRYWVQTAIIDAVSNVRYEDKRPREAQKFLLDLLRFNNNSQNLFSDHLFVAKLLVALANSFCASQPAGKLQAGTGSNTSNNRSKPMDMVLTFDDAMSDGDDDFNLGADIERMEIDTEDRMLLESALSEIERYRRMDEWTSSYQNVWTTAALEAKKRLMKTGVIPIDALEFVRYLQDGTMDTVQIKAFEALVELGLLLRPTILKLFLATMTRHCSPFVRDQLFKLFCRGLASIAFGEHEGNPNKDTTHAANANGANGSNGGIGSGDAAAATAAKKKDRNAMDIDDDDDDDDDTGGLIIVQGDTVTKKHQEEHARRESIDAAVTALRDAVKENKDFLAALWEAALSPLTGCTEKRNLLDLLEIMFDGDYSLLLTVKHPTMWKAARRVGTGIIDFKRFQRPLKDKAPPPAAVVPGAPASAVTSAVATPAPAPAGAVSLPPLLTTSSSKASITAAAPASAAMTTPRPVSVTVAPIASTSAVPRAASAVSDINATPGPGHRTALPGSAPRKPTLPKIKLQTNRISIANPGVSSATAAAAATPVAKPSSSSAAGGSRASTPILIRKPSVVAASVLSRAPTPSAPAKASPAPPAPARALPAKASPVKVASVKATPTPTPPPASATKKEAVADTISVLPTVQRKSSAAASGTGAVSTSSSSSSVASLAKSPTPAANFGDYGTAAASRVARSPLPSLAPPSASSLASPNKRKRQESVDQSPSRPRKMLKIKLPPNYRGKLSSRASNWLSGRTSPSKGSGDTIRSAGTPSYHKSSTPASSSSSNKQRGSATPGPSASSSKHHSSHGHGPSQSSNHSRSNSHSSLHHHQDKDRSHHHQQKRPTPSPSVTLPALKGDSSGWRSSATPDNKRTTGSPFSSTLASSSKPSSSKLSSAIRKPLPGSTTNSASPRPVPAAERSEKLEKTGSSSTPASASASTPAPRSSTPSTAAKPSAAKPATGTPASKPIFIKFKTKPANK